jgi:hypothetical protein
VALPDPVVVATYCWGARGGKSAILVVTTTTARRWQRSQPKAMTEKNGAQCAARSLCKDKKRRRRHFTARKITKVNAISATKTDGVALYGNDLQLSTNTMHRHSTAKGQ